MPLESLRQIPTRGPTRARGPTRVERDAGRVEGGSGRSSAAPTSSPKNWVQWLCACMVAASRSFTNILRPKLRRHQRLCRIRATGGRVPHRRNAARAAQPRLGVLQLGGSASLRQRTIWQWRLPFRRCSRRRQLSRPWSSTRRPMALMHALRDPPRARCPRVQLYPHHWRVPRVRMQPLGVSPLHKRLPNQVLE